MGIRLSSLKADLVREREGDWVEVPDWEGVAFRVRSTETPAFREARDGLLRRLQAMGRGRIDHDELSAQLGRLYARHLLTGWRGICDDDGRPIDYSPERAEALLGDPAYRLLAEAVLAAAQRLGHVEVQFVEEAAKN